MSRKSGGCFSGCGNFLVWAFAILLLIYGWVASPWWPWRAVEILTAIVVVGAFLAVRARRRGGAA